MDQEQAISRARQVKATHEAALLNLANVVGVGIGFKEKEGELTDQIALVVNVSEKKPLAELAATQVVPPELDGILTDVQEVGHFKAQ